jgi:hypothetical protein
MLQIQEIKAWKLQTSHMHMDTEAGIVTVMNTDEQTNFMDILQKNNKQWQH